MPSSKRAAVNLVGDSGSKTVEGITYSKPAVFDFLPVELISIIFTTLSESLPPDQRTRLPAFLSAVCKQFYTVVTDTPALWTTITNTSLRLTNYLLRSHNLLLHVELTYHPLANTPEQMRPLHHNAHRLATLHFTLAKPVQDLSTLLPSTLPVLHKLSITCEDSWHEKTAIGVECLNLQHLETSRINLLWGRVPTRSLTHLTIIDCAWPATLWRMFLILLGENNRLRSLKIGMLTVRFEYNAPPISPNSCIIPDLETLSLTTMISGNLVVKTLTALDAPHLQDLLLSGIGDGRAQWLFDDIVLNFPNLRRLALHNVPGVDKVVAHCIPRLPTITHLAVLSHPSILEEITLSSVAHHPESLPNLNELTLRSVSPHAIRRVVDRCSATGRRLRINMHVDSLGLRATASQADFDELDDCLAWLTQNAHITIFGKAASNLYRTWKDVQTGNWKTHALVRIGLSELDVWPDWKVFAKTGFET
ncbi:hypothetical protein FRB99_004579 [Tulasnella sp. 403]|nr:hypothetical protein FRB99_004579 [Tulasnella sp. 403]